MTIDVQAYRRRKHAQKTDESFSQTIKRVVRRPLVFGAAIGAACLAGIVRAPAAEVRFEVLGQVGGVMSAVAMQGDRAYVFEGPRLLVVDITNASSPVVLGRSAPLRWGAKDAVVAGSYVFAASGFNGLSVYDVSAPSNPAAVAHLSSVAPLVGLAISQDHLYVAAQSGGLLVINVANPLQPILVGQLSFGGASASAVAVAGTSAYVTIGSGALHICDISNPSSPQLVGTLTLPAFANGVAASGALALVTTASGLRLIDGSVPASPTEVGSIDLPAAEQDVRVSGARALVLTAISGAYEVDFSTPSNPVLVRSLSLPGEPRNLAWDGARALLAYGADGLRVVTTPAGGSLAQAALLPPRLPDPWDILVRGTYAYVTQYSGRLAVVDVGNPSAPQVVSQSVVSSALRYLGLAGDLLLVPETGSFALRLYDVTNPAAPVQRGRVALCCGAPTDVAAHDGYAYVVAQGAGLQVVRVSDPNNPALVNTIDTPGVALGIAMVGSEIFVGDNQGGLRLFDAANPGQPMPGAVLNLGGNVTRTTAVQELIFTDLNSVGLKVVDASDPNAPQVVGGYANADYRNYMATMGDYGLAGQWNGPGVALDLAVLTAPRPSGEIGVEFANSAYVSGRTAYVVSPEVGLYVLRASLAGDANDDGCVDSDDLDLALQNFGCAAGLCAGDVDRDGDTDQDDLDLMLFNFGPSCL